MGQDASMDHHCRAFSYLVKCIPYLLLLDTCSSLTLRTPSTTIHGIVGKPLLLPVHYSFNTSASGIQIIWLLERSNLLPIYLVNSMNQTVVPDLEFQHKFTLRPPNASLLIHSLNFTDEGNYIVKVNIPGNTTISATQKIEVTVNVPVSKPIIHSQPSHEVVENIGNITFNCSVVKGNRVTYQWLKNGNVLRSSQSYTFSKNNERFIISPVMKEDVGNYSCLAKNPVSEMESDPVAPTIYYGPYGLTVSSDKGHKVGDVFAVNIGESVQFDCSADSNPPITSEWIQRTENTTLIINKGPYFKIVSYKGDEKTMYYVCRAYNNITRKVHETQFTVMIKSKDVKVELPKLYIRDLQTLALQMLLNYNFYDSLTIYYSQRNSRNCSPSTSRRGTSLEILSLDLTHAEMLLQNENSLSPLAAITGVSLFLILCICLLFVWKKYRLHKAIHWKFHDRRRSSTEYRRTQIFSGHEDALNDFGIYEFVALPDPSVPLRGETKLQ